MIETLYWITRLDGLNIFFTLVATFSAAILIGSFITMTMFKDNRSQESTHTLAKSICKYTVVSMFISIIGLLFVPTTKDALMIYGVGSTLEYIKQNETAKELPDKCIEVLDAYIESLNKNKTK